LNDFDATVEVGAVEVDPVVVVVVVELTDWRSF
jgi:hypothetical protein